MDAEGSERNVYKSSKQYRLSDVHLPNSHDATPLLPLPAPPFPFPFPLNPARGVGSNVSSPSGVSGGAPIAIEFHFCAF